jgi:hypothetical protein
MPELANPDDPELTTPGQDERLEVILIPKAADDLQKTQDRTNLSRADITNRALSLYEFIDSEVTAGAELILRRDGQDFLVKLL